jgi:histidine triad (HIT) family protein
MSADCVFCQVVSLEIPARIVRINDATTAFLDMRQPHAGHVLVVPNRHVENVFDLSAEDGSAVMTATREVARAARDAFSPEGLSLWQSVERPGSLPRGAPLSHARHAALDGGRAAANRSEQARAAT